jgi:predicted RNase H-like HicB family nuclease
MKGGTLVPMSAHRASTGFTAPVTEPNTIEVCYNAEGVMQMKLIVTIERDETGMIVAECPAIPGCVSQGRTEDEALANIREAIQGCLETRAANGMPLTIQTREVEVTL